MTAPKAPPAPVISRMGAASTRPCVISALMRSARSSPRISSNENRKPISSAHSGLPRKAATVNSRPEPSGRDGKAATEPMQISAMGSTIGMKAISGDGICP